MCEVASSGRAATARAVRTPGTVIPFPVPVPVPTTRSVGDEYSTAYIRATVTSPIPSSLPMTSCLHVEEASYHTSRVDRSVWYPDILAVKFITSAITGRTAVSIQRRRQASSVEISQK